MSETEPNTPNQTTTYTNPNLGPSSDPSLTVGNAPQDSLKIRFETFEDAKTSARTFSKEFIDRFTSNYNAINGIKGFLDEVAVTERDREVIENSDRIADLFVQTTDMIARNLRVKVAPDLEAVTTEQVKTDGEELLHKLWNYRLNVPEGIKRWCHNATDPQAKIMDKFIDKETEAGLMYKDLDFDQPGVRANFKIQRQAIPFIMAYTDRRVAEKMTEKAQPLNKRIYLNPDMEATPLLFEQLLQSANRAGLSIQLKMLQRAAEAASAQINSAKGREVGLRGDGIVVYTDSEHADEVLSMVLALAKDNPAAFADRPHSRTPQNVAEGIAIADEPLQAPGESLTTHRARILSDVARLVINSGKKGEEARVLFHELWQQSAIDNRIDPNNFAFNTSP